MLSVRSLALSMKLYVWFVFSARTHDINYKFRSFSRKRYCLNLYIRDGTQIDSLERLRIRFAISEFGSCQFEISWDFCPVVRVCM